MRKLVGYLPKDLTNEPTSGGLTRTMYPQASSINPTDNSISATHVIQDGDILVSVSARLQSSSGSAEVGAYAIGGSASTRVVAPNTVTVTGNVRTWITSAFNTDLSAFVGQNIVPAVCPTTARWSYQVQNANSNRYTNTSFPETVNNTAWAGNTNTPLVYLTIESPPPEGYEDIVVGSNPFYGDDRSIVNAFEGEPPKEGDQLRYALTSRLGANITVNTDLTYSGTYPEGVIIPSSDDIYVSYWNNDTQEWVDYVVTVNFQQESQAPVNTELPTITGSGVVREQLTTTSGEWSGGVNSLAYRWFVDNVDTSITSQTFTPVDSSYGKFVSVAVTAKNQFGSSTAVSEQVGPIAGLTPSINSLVVSGSAYVGYTLTINISSTGVPTPTITAKWFRSLGGVDEEIVGQTGNTYTLTEDDLGYQIYAQVELVNDVGSMTETSDKTSPVSEYRFSAKDISLRNGWYWAFSQMVSILKNLQQQLDNLKGG